MSIYPLHLKTMIDLPVPRAILGDMRVLIERDNK